MKRTLAIILSVFMTLPLISCGKKPEQPASDGTSPPNGVTAE